jgi:disulfide bond formation protein DsbB
MSEALATRSRAVLSALAVVCVAAIGLALVSQHVYDMQPCPWCVLQRAIFAAIALVCLPGAVLAAGWARRLSGALALVLAGAGLAAALWQHFVAAATSSCKLTLADRIVSGLGLDAWAPEVFAPRASCADAAVDLLGLPYEFWSAGLFLAVGVVAAALTFARRP